MATEQLSGITVVIIIAVGVQGCVMLFLFAKRQIMRFALRNRRGPHTSLGQGAPKTLRKEAEKLLENIPKIKHEPKINTSSHSCKGKQPEHFHRAKALELYVEFEREISEGYSNNYTRTPGSNVRSFLLKCTNGPLKDVDSLQIHLLCDDYEHARHHHEKFGEEKLKAFSERISALRSRLRANIALKPHPSPMPLRPPATSSPTGGRRANNSRTKGPSVSVSFGARGVPRSLPSAPPAVAPTEVVMVDKNGMNSRKSAAV